MKSAPQRWATSFMAGGLLMGSCATCFCGSSPALGAGDEADPFREKADFHTPGPEEGIRTTVDALLRAGLADPRGLPYRHVTVREGGVAHPARGWVLPVESGDGQRQVIGWNGLVNPVETVGEPADLDADLAIIRGKGWFCEEPFDNYQENSLEDLIAKFEGAPRMMHPWAAPYLLHRLGHPIEVGDDHADPFAPEPEHPPDAPPRFPAWRFDSSDPDVLLDFARHLRDDGVAAYCAGDFAIAAERLRLFDRVWEQVRIVPGEEQEGDPFRNPSSALGFDLTWREVLVDARRRTRPRPGAEGTEIGIAIDSWDDLTAWDEDAPPEAFRKVVAAGPAAIGPILDCLEKDPRWTRIRHETGSSHTTILRVRDLAIEALNQVLRFPAVEAPSGYAPAATSAYEELAAKAREFCERHEFQVGGELWYRILADPEEDLDFQIDAALAIVTPEDCGPYHGITDPWFMRDAVRDRYEAPRISQEGRILRGRSHPAVLELMERAWARERLRVDEKLAGGEPEEPFPVACGVWPRSVRWSAHLLMRCMEEWQPGNVAALKRHYDWLVEALRNSRANESPGEFMLGSMCEEILIRRFWAEDETAMADFEDLFREAIQSGDLPIEVMLAFPSADGMDRLAREAFVGPGAPFSFTRRPWKPYDPRLELIDADSDLLIAPSFRKALLEGLECRQVVGILTVEKEEGLMRLLADEDPERIESLQKGFTMSCAQPAGTRIQIRVCDLLAYHLSPKHGPGIWTHPKFRIDDPVEVRDQAIAKWTALLERRN